jgi:chromosome segregation ATPase
VSSPLENLDERIEALEAAAADIREETRLAHEAVKELRLVQREVRDMIDEARTMLDTEVATMVQDAVKRHVDAGLDEFWKSLNDEIEKTDKAIAKRFNSLANLYLTGNADGRGPSIFDGKTLPPPSRMDNES